MTMMFFTAAPTANELLGYIAGALRDCLGCAADEAIEWEGQLLWDEFGGEAGFRKDREDAAAINLAARMSMQLRRIAASAPSEAVRELALINSEAFAEGHQLLEIESAQLLAA
jgi:hypothetical protein